MVAGGARCVVLTVVAAVVVVVVVSAYHTHHPLQRLQYANLEDEGRPATSQGYRNHETRENKARERHKNVHARLRRFVGDSHIGIMADQDDLGDEDSPRPSLIVCEQLMVLRHISPSGLTVSCTFSDRLMTPEARARQMAKWKREAEGSVQFVSVDGFMEVVETCLGLEESPSPPPPNWAIISLIQIRAPGTLWCGMGQTAEDLSELGEWERVDHCCRLHDLCPVQLPPFVHYRGAINITPKPLSHCVCDMRFAACLYKVNNMRANFIFHTYFNVLFRGGFCATIQPRLPRMGFTRGTLRFWQNLVDAFKLMADSGEGTTDRRRRKVVSTASQMESTLTHSPTTTTTTITYAASPVLTIDYSPSLNKPPQTMAPKSSFTLIITHSSSSSSSHSSSSFSHSSFSVVTTTTSHNTCMTPLPTNNHEAHKNTEFTSVLLQPNSCTGMTDSLTASSVHGPAEASKSVFVASNPTLTPPLSHTVKTIEALPHGKEKGKQWSNTSESFPGKMETSERHQDDKTHSAGIDEEHEVVLPRRVNDLSRHEGAQEGSDLQIISFRRYVKEFYVEEENASKKVNQDEDEQEEEKEKSS